MDVFDPEHPESPRLQTVPIRRKSYDSEEPYDLVQAAIDVVNALRTYGLYTIYELPGALRQCFHIDYYLAQVDNGGHEQYFKNSRKSVDVHEDVRDGLRALADPRFSQLFDEVYAYATSSKERFEAILARGGFTHPEHGPVDPWISAKDDEFYRLKKSVGLIDLNSTFLRTSGAVRPTPDAEWKFEMAKIIDANPLLERRLLKLGQEKRDFAGELVRNAPLKRSYFSYAKELASRNGIELPSFPVENHTTHDEKGEELWWNVFKLEKGEFAIVVFRGKKEAILLRSRLDESGKLGPPPPPLDRMPMEQAEV
jgi:hypothetical protein